MSINGTINGSYSGYSNRYEVRIVYEYDQNVPGNYSTMLSCKLQIRSKTNGSYGAYSNKGSASLSYAGYSVTWKPITFDFRASTDPGPWVTVITLDGKQIPHNDDGTKSITISASFATNDSDISSITTASANGTVTLQSISRVSQFGTLNPFIIENSWSVPVTKYISGATDTLTIEYSSFSKTISPYVSGQTIQFSAGELATLYGLAPNTSTIPFDLTITTGSYGSNTATINGTITPVPPTFTATITATPTSAVSGQTNVNVTLSAAATAYNSASIAEYVVTLGSQTVRSNSYSTTFSFAGANGDTITAYAVDSRGFTSDPITETITLYPYATPTISGSITRTPTMASTTATLTLSGAYSVVPNQALTATYKYKIAGGSYNADTAITLTYSGGAWTFSATLLDTFNIADVYTFSITVTDIYTSATTTITLLSAEPTLDIDTATQRVKVGGFIDTEDNLSLSVAGDIYEGGQKLRDKYGIPMYESGDTFTVPASQGSENAYHISGTQTSSGKIIWFTLPMPKSMANVTPSVSSLKVNIRYYNGYSIAGYFVNYGTEVANGGSYTILLHKITDYVLTIGIQRSSAYNGNGNMSVTVEIDHILVNFT